LGNCFPQRGGPETGEKHAEGARPNPGFLKPEPSHPPDLRKWDLGAFTRNKGRTWTIEHKKTNRGGIKKAPSSSFGKHLEDFNLGVIECCNLPEGLVWEGLRKNSWASKSSRYFPVPHLTLW